MKRTSGTQETILIVDDDASVITSLSLLLKQAGYRSQSATTPEQALSLIESESLALVLQDMNFSRQTTGEEGVELLKRIKARRPDLPVILITAWGSIGLAVLGVRAGASDFITKPWSHQQIIQSVNTALGLAAANSSRSPGQTPTREELDSRYDFKGLVGSDPKFLRVLELIGRVAPTEASVLITGESGVGKELIADAIHRNSHRRDKPFVKVNLGGIPAQLFESEMFGHVKGAFTDARADRKGRFETADGGTIFLDEIGDLDASAQVKLLRVLQDRTYEALGSSATRSVDVRVISATNRNLIEMVAAGVLPMTVTDDYLAAMRAVWTQERPAYQGRWVRFERIQAHPRPVQKPTPPIVIGGHTRAAFRRAVEHGHGWYGFALDAAAVTRCVEGLREAGERYPRPAALGPLEISVTPRGRIDRGAAETFAALGVHRLILLPPRGADAAALEKFVAGVATDLIGGA